MICPLCQLESSKKICDCGFHFIGNCRRCNTTYPLSVGHKCPIKYDSIKLKNITFHAYYHRSMVGNHCLQLIVSKPYMIFDLTCINFLFTLSGENAVNTIEKLNKSFGLNLPLRPLTMAEIEPITIEGIYDITYKKDGSFNRLQRIKRVDI